MAKGGTSSKRTIYTYGFDKAGFQTPTDGGENADFRIAWIPFQDPRRLDDADGVILMQGIFETIRIREVGRGWTIPLLFLGLAKLLPNF